MSLIEWKDEFKLGVPSVDHEHQELIELINSLGELMAAKGSYQVVVESLGEIYAQISGHFALEEKVMRDSHYPLYEDHKADHEILLDELLDIMDNVEDDGSYDAGALATGLDRWFSEHFGTHDAKLHHHYHR